MKQIEKMYLKHRLDVYNYLLSITHDPTLSEDLLSETFVKAIYSIRNFRGDSSVKTWLFSIARHLWLQNLRKTRIAVEEYRDLLSFYLTDSITDSLLAQELTDRVEELLATKDERTQKIVKMRMEGISYSEIAEKLPILENSARVIHFRTKKWLKSILRKEKLI